MTALLAAHGLQIPGRLAPSELRVEGPALIALLGPNGGGKTSLLRALAGVDDAHGTVSIEGETLDRAAPVRRGRLVALCPASHEVAWPVPLRDFVALPGNAPDRVAEQLDRFELSPLADRAMTDLSTGERSRAMIARTLASDARLLLLDEPLSNLDPYWVLRTLDLLAERRDSGAAIIVALHDFAQVPRFDRAIVVAGQSIVADGLPDALLASEAVERLFRVSMVNGRPAISPTADPRSSR